jgi:hypothetical protein
MLFSVQPYLDNHIEIGILLHVRSPVTRISSDRNTRDRVYM